MARDRFNEDQLSTPKERPGATWHHSAVLEMLKNRAVLGEYQPKSCPAGHRGSRRPADGEPAPGYYPAIVSEEQFYRVQALIAATRPKSGRKPNIRQVSNLFSGTVHCRHCRGTFGIHVASRKGGRPALRCYGASRGLCTNRRRYRYDLVEAAILRHVHDFDLAPHAPQDDPHEAKIAAARGRLADLDRQLQTLLDRIETGSPDELVEARYAKRRTQWTALKAEIAELEKAAQFNRVRLTPEMRMREIADLSERMVSLEDRELYDLRIRLSQAIKDVVTSIEFADDGVFFVYVLDGFSSYVFRNFEPIWAAPGTPELLASPKYGKRFTRGDPAREATARRVLRNLASAK